MSTTTRAPDFADSADAVEPTPVLSIAPVALPVAGRAVPLEVRVSAPTTGENLPVIVISHGAGRSHHLSSLDGYAPLRDFWAAGGFVVVQPTHLSSARVSLDPEHPDAPLYWRSRVEDVSAVLDHLDEIETAVPSLAGRVNRAAVAVVGHSIGGMTAAMVLGARLTDPQDGTLVELRDDRVTAGILLAAPGRGGDALSAFAAENFPYFSTFDYTTMTTSTLVIAGDADESPHLTVHGPEWHADPYHLSPGPKSLVTLFDGGHNLGGISGYDVAETTDDSPDRVSAVQDLTLSYLRTQFGVDELAWKTATTALESATPPLGRVESK